MAARGEDDRLDVLVVEFLPSGGMFHFAFQFAAAVAAAGHRVTLLTGPDPELTARHPGLEVLDRLPTWHPNAGLDRSPLTRRVRRGLRALRLLLAWLVVLREVRRRRPDVVQFGELRFGVDRLGLSAVARLGGAGIVVDVAHNPLPYDVTGRAAAVEKSGRRTRAALTRAYADCDLVLALGEGPRQDLVAHFPAVRRTAVCGHGDYSAVLPAEPRPADLVPAGATPPAALFFGAWTRYKNLPLLLDAFALVRTTLPEARLTLAGPVMPDVDLERISARADEVGHVTLAPGYVPMAAVPGLFAAHRAVLFTYATVNISGSVHMAYTLGRPVVATRVGAMADAVRDQVTGFLTDPTPAAVATALTRLLSDPQLAGRMGDAARAHARTAGSWSGVAERAVAAYRDTLAGRAAEPQPTPA